MADTHQYQKQRKLFGRHPAFEDSQTKMVCEQMPMPDLKNSYILRDPNKINLDNIQVLSEHTVNTGRVETKDRGMAHVVGGWPKDIDFTDEQHVSRYTKKLNRDLTLGFASATKDLTRTTERCIKQNNEIDLFEEYFASEKAENMSEEINTKTLMIFKDPNQIKRAVAKIAWQVDGQDHRVAVAYAQLRFQQEPPNMPKNSYIWNLNDPNRPEITLEPTSPLCCMQWHHKIGELIAAGSYNGSVCVFDLRQSQTQGALRPTLTSVLENSHHDPVYDLSWATGSRAGNEFFSTSTDGRVLWWDMRNLEKPTDKMILQDQQGVEGAKIYGGTCLCYNQDAHPHKFLVGSEQGYAVMCQRRNNKAEVQGRWGDEQGKHHGPIYSMYRNPIHLKYFLTVGDWSAKIWSEELKIPIMQTRYHNSYLTDGCWSKTRAGLFFLTRMDGFLDVWDFFYRQNEVAYSQKISDAVLTSIHVEGSMAAIGDAEGTTTILSLCPPLYDQTLQPKEREIMLTIFDREFRREKTLDVARRLDAKKSTKPKAQEDDGHDQLENMLSNIEENFFETVGENEEDREFIKRRGAEAAQAINEANEQAATYGGLLEGETYQFDGQRTDKESMPQPTAFAFNVEKGGTLHFQGSGNTNVNGIIAGDKITLTVQFEDGQLVFEGVVSNDTISGTFTEAAKDKSGEFMVERVPGNPSTNFQK